MAGTLTTIAPVASPQPLKAYNLNDSTYAAAHITYTRVDDENVFIYTNTGKWSVPNTVLAYPFLSPLPEYSVDGKRLYLCAEVPSFGSTYTGAYATVYCDDAQTIFFAAFIKEFTTRTSYCLTTTLLDMIWCIENGMWAPRVVTNDVNIYLSNSVVLNTTYDESCYTGLNSHDNDDRLKRGLDTGSGSDYKYGPIVWEYTGTTSGTGYAQTWTLIPRGRTKDTRSNKIVSRVAPLLYKHQTLANAYATTTTGTPVEYLGTRYFKIAVSGGNYEFAPELNLLNKTTNLATIYTTQTSLSTLLPLIGTKRLIYNIDLDRYELVDSSTDGRGLWYIPTTDLPTHASQSITLTRYWNPNGSDGVPDGKVDPNPKIVTISISKYGVDTGSLVVLRDIDNAVRDTYGGSGENTSGTATPYTLSRHMSPTDVPISADMLAYYLSVRNKLVSVYTALGLRSTWVVRDASVYAEQPCAPVVPRTARSASTILGDCLKMIDDIGRQFLMYAERYGVYADNQIVSNGVPGCLVRIVSELDGNVRWLRYNLYAMVAAETDIDVLTLLTLLPISSFRAAPTVYSESAFTICDKIADMYIDNADKMVNPSRTWVHYFEFKFSDSTDIVMRSFIMPGYPTNLSFEYDFPTYRGTSIEPKFPEYSMTPPSMYWRIRHGWGNGSRIPSVEDGSCVYSDWAIYYFSVAANRQHWYLPHYTIMNPSDAINVLTLDGDYPCRVSTAEFKSPLPKYVQYRWVAKLQDENQTLNYVYCGPRVFDRISHTWTLTAGTCTGSDAGSQKCGLDYLIIPDLGYPTTYRLRRWNYESGSPVLVTDTTATYETPTGLAVVTSYNATPVHLSRTADGLFCMITHYGKSGDSGYNGVTSRTTFFGVWDTYVWNDSDGYVQLERYEYS